MKHEPKPLLLWLITVPAGHSCVEHARTKSEARAQAKPLFGCGPRGRLPVGTVVKRIELSA